MAQCSLVLFFIFVCISGATFLYNPEDTGEPNALQRVLWMYDAEDERNMTWTDHIRYIIRSVLSIYGQVSVRASAIPASSAEWVCTSFQRWSFSCRMTTEPPHLVHSQYVRVDGGGLFFLAHSPLMACLPPRFRLRICYGCRRVGRWTTAPRPTETSCTECSS